MPAARSPLRALLLAEGISRAGNVVTATAVPWFVLETSNSAPRAGLAGVAAGLPIVLSLLFGGALVDRWGRRRVSIVADLASGCFVALIPLLHATVGLRFSTLLALIFLSALLDVPGSLARMSLLPDLAARAGLPNERAYALNESGALIAGLIGPALTGLLIVALGAPSALWIDAASFGIAALLMTRVSGTDDRPAATPDDEAICESGFRADFVAGVRFVLRDPFLRALVTLFAVMNLLIGPLESVILPVYARVTYGSAFDFGLLTAASGAGAIAAAVCFGAVGGHLPRRAVFLGGYLCVPLALGALAITPSLGVALGIVAVIGFAVGLIDPLEYTIYFERLPAALRARGLGVIGAFGWCSVPVGRAVTGALLGRWGVRTTLIALAVTFCWLPLLLVNRPSLRDMLPPS